MPTSIPPFDNVPAPGDLVKSAWAVQITQAVVDQSATNAADVAALTAHLADATDAHDASAVSFVPTGTVAATNVQAAIAEVAADADAGGTVLSGHLTDTLDAHDASAISFVPFTASDGLSHIDSTQVQAAIEELAERIVGTIERAEDAARGLVTHVVTTTETVVAAFLTEIDGATVTWSPDYERRYRITAYVNEIGSTELDGVAVRVQLCLADGTVLTQAAYTLPVGITGFGQVVLMEIEPIALTGTQTRKLVMSVTDPVAFGSTTVRPGVVIQVEDIGAS